MMTFTHFSILSGSRNFICSLLAVFYIGLAIFLTSCLLVSAPVLAQGKIRPAGINGSVGAGYVMYSVDEPQSANMKFDQGVFAAVRGEKGLGVFNLYLTITLGYLTGTGTTNYDYTTLAGATYQAADVGFKSNLFQAGLGLRLKLIDGYWIRPYIEGGGTGGYFQIKYDNLRTKLGNPATTDYKSEDSLLDFGRYAEGGLEVAFSDKFGIVASARFGENETKVLDTLGKNTLKYKNTTYYFSLLTAF